MNHYWRSILVCPFLKIVYPCRNTLIRMYKMREWPTAWVTGDSRSRTNVLERQWHACQLTRDIAVQLALQQTSRVSGNARFHFAISVYRIRWCIASRLKIHHSAPSIRKRSDDIFNQYCCNFRSHEKSRFNKTIFNIHKLMKYVRFDWIAPTLSFGRLINVKIKIRATTRNIVSNCTTVC